MILYRVLISCELNLKVSILHFTSRSCRALSSIFIGLMITNYPLPCFFLLFFFYRYLLYIEFFMKNRDIWCAQMRNELIKRLILVQPNVLKRYLARTPRTNSDIFPGCFWYESSGGLIGYELMWRHARTVETFRVLSSPFDLRDAWPDYAGLRYRKLRLPNTLLLLLT